MLVIIGVAGELLADGGIFLFSKQLQTIADLEIADLTKESGNAKASAESAAAASFRAESSAKRANDEAKGAKENADAAGRVAEKARDLAAEVAWLVSARHVEDRDALVEKLKPFKGLSVILGSYRGDTEARGVCTQLLAVAHSAQMIPVDKCEQGQPTVPTLTGIVVTGPDDDVVESLCKALGGTRFIGGASCGPFGKVPHPPELAIFVGVKNPFWIGPLQDEAPRKKTINKKQTKP